MTKKEIFEYYANKTLNLDGANLGECEGLKFGLLSEQKEIDLEAELEYVKRLRELDKQYKHHDYWEEYQQMRRDIEDEINEDIEKGLYPLSEQHRKLLNFLEEIFFVFNESTSKVTPLQVVDGHVQIAATQTLHESSIKNLEQMQNYANLGIVASEWFGVLESEGEGRYCTFVKTGEKKKGFSRGKYSTCVKFYIDEKNEDWQTLVSLDFFEYEHIKKTNPEKLQQLYSKEIIELYDEIIEPLSSGGKDMHDDPELNYSTWKAIPAGIPSRLIVGIEIDSRNTELMSHISEISKMFPNAVIFDENKQVLNKEDESE